MNNLTELYQYGSDNESDLSKHERYTEICKSISEHLGGYYSVNNIFDFGSGQCKFRNWYWNQKRLNEYRSKFGSHIHLEYTGFDLRYNCDKELYTTAKNNVSIEDFLFFDLDNALILDKEYDCVICTGVIQDLNKEVLNSFISDIGKINTKSTIITFRKETENSSSHKDLFLPSIGLVLNIIFEKIKNIKDIDVRAMKDERVADNYIITIRH